MFLNAKVAAIAAGAVILAGGTVGAGALDKSVTLSVDGSSSNVHSFGSTVGEVLAGRGIVPGERDLVFPDVSSPVHDGSEIVVEFARKVDLTVDGEPRTFYTTATRLDAALAQAQVHLAQDAAVSVSRSTSIGRDGIEVTVNSPKTITVVLDGRKQRLRTTAATVAELLGELGRFQDADDRVSPGVTVPLAEGMTVRFEEVDVAFETRTKTLGFSTVRKPTDTLYVGQTRVLTPGKPGKARLSVQVTYVDGDARGVKVLQTTVTRAPATQVVLVGTKGSGAGINLARAAMWDRIARCESGGRWHINTGNGYYGGLQFALRTWIGVGGRDFAAYPHQASRAEQITVANRLYAKAGLSPWGCRHAA